jgi:UDP-N-acetylmuramyl tripeptide synthase
MSTASRFAAAPKLKLRGEHNVGNVLAAAAHQ